MSNIRVIMYDATLLEERMAEKGLNWYRLGKRAKVDPKTAKRVVTTGTGNPDSIKAVAKALDLELSEIVKRHTSSAVEPLPKKKAS